MIKPFCTIKNRIGCGGYLVMNKKFDRGTREYEKEILQKSKYFFCRTNWDRAQITFNNPQAQIFQGEELLRPDFTKNPAVGIYTTASATVYLCPPDSIP